MVTASNPAGTSGPSNTARSLSWCLAGMSLESETGGEALSMDEETLMEAGLWDEPVRRSYYYLGGQRVAMREVAGEPGGVVYWLVGDHLGTTSLVLKADGTVHSQARHL